MGDRANVYVQDRTPYLTRIVFDKMTGLTGMEAGFSAVLCGNDHPIIVLAPDAGRFRFSEEGNRARTTDGRELKANCRVPRGVARMSCVPHPKMGSPLSGRSASEIAASASDYGWQWGWKACVKAMREVVEKTNRDNEGRPPLFRHELTLEMLVEIMETSAKEMI